MRIFTKMVGAVLLTLFLICSPVMNGPEAFTSEADTDTLKSLIKDLEKVIEDADRRMVAHPTFLKELRALVERYQAKIRQVFFSDNFSDGDYKRSPKWVVKSGSFSITPQHRLRSQVREKPSPSSRREEFEYSKHRNRYRKAWVHTGQKLSACTL